MSRKLAAIAICIALLGTGCSPSSPSLPSAPEGTQAEAKDPTKNEVPPPEEKDERFEEASSAEQDGVRLTVRVLKALTAGSTVRIDVKVANSGKAPVVFGWDSRVPLLIEVALTTKDGKPVPFTLYGQKTIAPTDLRDQLAALRGSYHQAKVSPGEKRGLSVANLALFYDLTLPGEYLVTVSKSIRVSEAPIKDVVLRVDRIPFTIKPP